MITFSSARQRRALRLAVNAFWLTILIPVLFGGTTASQERRQKPNVTTEIESPCPAVDTKLRDAPFRLQKRHTLLNAGRQPREIDKKGLGDFLRNARKQHGLSALLCGVWRGDDQVITVALGNSMTNVPATKEMHLHVGGVTLTCVCMVLLRLVDEGRVSLDDKLARWYPKMPQANAVTLRMLANCTSGYPDYVRSKTFVDAFEKDPFRQWSAQELIDIGLATPLKYKPGKGWNYSHTNFVILGEVLKKVARMPMGTLLDRHILKPLGLKETEYPANATMRFPVLHAFSSERGTYEETTYWSPSWTSHTGRMTSTLHDLGVVARAIGSGSLLSKKSRKEQIAPTTVGLANNRADRYYAMGIAVVNGWMFQNPNFNGYNLVFAHLPSGKLSVVIATTMGPKCSPDVAYSTVVFRELVKRLTPDLPVPK